MKQSIKYQKASIFRRICSMIFDGIILACIAVFIHICVISPIVTNNDTYKVKTAEFQQRCLDTHLVVKDESTSTTALVYTDKSSDIDEFAKNNNCEYTLKDLNDARKEATYKTNGVTYNLFIDDGTGNYIDAPFTGDEYKEVSSTLIKQRRVFNVSLATELLKKEINANVDFKALSNYQISINSLGVIIDVVVATLITCLLFPMIFADRATLGKKMFHFQVISTKTGKIATRFQIFFRFVFMALICIALALFTYGASLLVSIVFIVVTKKRQTLHDIISQTTVVPSSIDERMANTDNIFEIVYDDGVQDDSEVVDAQVSEETIIEQEETNINE